MIRVALSDVRQVIDGFGASSAWTAPNITNAQANEFFSTTTGLGHSLPRVRIGPDGTTGETGTAQKVVPRGAKVWTIPWSPPSAWKSNGDVNNGCTLFPEYQDGWAARPADFAVAIKAAGAPLATISAQNEPNYTATWESCVWAPAELTAFKSCHHLRSKGAVYGVFHPIPGFLQATLHQVRPCSTMVQARLGRWKQLGRGRH